MRVEELDAVPIGIAHIDEECVAGTMAAGAEFHVGGKAHFGGKVADLEEMIGLRDRERRVMEPRPIPRGKDDVMRIAFALQEDEQQLLGSIRRNVLREPKAHAHPEFTGLLNVRDQQLEVIEPLRHRTAVLREGDEEARLHLHGGAKFDRRAACVRDMQRSALMRDVDPFRRQSGLVEKCLRFLQILLAEDAHADALGLRLAAPTLEHEAVVTGLGDAAEIERIAILVADDEAEEIHVEISACRQVADREHRMAGARDVERRTVDRLRNAHGALQPTLFGSETF